MKSLNFELVSIFTHLIVREGLLMVSSSHRKMHLDIWHRIIS